MQEHQRANARAISRWILLPLRLFLGVTFAYAGLQKLTDPQFFQPSAQGYIGKQIAGFATSSPLHNFLLLFVAPHAVFYGLLVAYGELAIGLAVLVGLLLRPAAFFGLLLNILFFLTASWRVYPYFYGSDIVFAFCWLTLLLNGAANTGLPTLDEQLTSSLLSNKPSVHRQRIANLLSVMLGTVQPTSPATQASGPIRYVRGHRESLDYDRTTRRNFLIGALAGSASTFALVTLTYVLRIFSHLTDTEDIAARIPVPPANVVHPNSIGNVSSGSSAVIAQVNAVPGNSAVSFTIPASGDPGILVHLNNGQFFACDALCTHAGCQVDYDSASQLLVCPCHGATFDPAKNAAVVQGPANLPLSSIAIHVDSATGAITLSNH